jgi:hypothetical protein
VAQRITRSKVTFPEPFYVTALEDQLPAGTYDVQTEEEIVEGNERTVYIRVATALIVRSTGLVQTVPIDPQLLAEGIPSA